MGLERKRHPAKGGAVQLGGEQSNHSGKGENGQPQARQFRVIIARDLWRRCVVSVDPATITRQPRSFPDYAAALAYAEALAKLEGWPVIDRAGGEA
jgi:hypothetical protein